MTPTQPHAVSPQVCSVSLAEILSSLSYALDLTEGQPVGHAVRTCLIGTRIGMALGMEQAALRDLYYTLLMKDAGCSSNAAKMFALFGGDEIEAKRDVKVVDWSRLASAAKYTAAHLASDEPFLARAKRFVHIAANTGEATNALMQARCSRGAHIALRLGLGEAPAEGIRALDEHWNGKGAPLGLRGLEIPLLGRIACLAQTMEVFFTTYGVERAYEVAHRRSGSWFDPSMVKLAESFRHDAPFWESVRERPNEALRATIPFGFDAKATEADIDAVCDAFAGIVDAKSSFTGEHSTRVCAYALEIADALGVVGERRTNLRRAALLHDLGKLAVPNSILDKPGPLTDAEFDRVKQHPRFTHRILKGIPGFERLAEVAGAHHERLDGRGYFMGLTGDVLDMDMRLLAVADVFDALTAERPYRGALPAERVAGILNKEAGTKLDGDCVAVLLSRSPDAPAPVVSSV